MRQILIIFLILSSGPARTQDYFFEFVDGWVNNFSIELEDSYLYMGLGLSGSPTQHRYLYNELNLEGNLIDQTEYEIDSLSTTSTMLNSQMAIELDGTNLIIAGVFGQNISAGELYGSLVKYNTENNAFEVIVSVNVDLGTQFFV